jgi:hypothetical protein
MATELGLGGGPALKGRRSGFRQIGPRRERRRRPVAGSACGVSCCRVLAERRHRRRLRAAFRNCGGLGVRLSRAEDGREGSRRFNVWRRQGCEGRPTSQRFAATGLREAGLRFNVSPRQAFAGGIANVGRPLGYQLVGAHKAFWCGAGRSIEPARCPANEDATRAALARQTSLRDAQEALVQAV